MRRLVRDARRAAAARAQAHDLTVLAAARPRYQSRREAGKNNEFVITSTFARCKADEIRHKFDICDTADI